MLPYAPDVRLAILIAGVPFVIGLATTSLTTVFQARLQMGRAAIADVAGRLAGFGALVAVVVADLGFLAVVASTAVGAAVALAVTVVLLRPLLRVRPLSDRERWRELLVPAIPIGLALAVNEIYFRADTFILSLFRPFAEVGLYTLAYRVFELLALLPAIVMTSVFPLLSRYLPDQRDLAARVLRRHGRRVRRARGAASRPAGSCSRLSSCDWWPATTSPRPPRRCGCCCAPRGRRGSAACSATR